MNFFGFFCCIFLVYNQISLINAAPVCERCDLNHAPRIDSGTNGEEKKPKTFFGVIATARQYANFGLGLAIIALICSLGVACCLLCVCFWLCSNPKTPVRRSRPQTTSSVKEESDYERPPPPPILANSTVKRSESDCLLVRYNDGY